jgi:hypothetical protein
MPQLSTAMGVLTIPDPSADTPAIARRGSGKASGTSTIGITIAST